jgi:hypothetical protein
MTVLNNRRQENICCYNNLEWQLMIEWETCRPCSSSTGGNFSVSVIPYWSPPLIYTSQASLLKDMPKAVAHDVFVVPDAARPIKSFGSRTAGTPKQSEVHWPVRSLRRQSAES